MRWCTARARCSARCRATSGSDSPTSARCFAYQYTRPGKAAPVHGRGAGLDRASGTTTRASTGTWPTEPLNAGLVPVPGRPRPRSIASGRSSGGSDPDSAGFQWLDADDRAHSVYAYLRRDGGRSVVVAAQPHAGASARLPGRRCRGGALVAAPVERRAPVRRERLRPGGGRPHRGSIAVAASAGARSVSIFRRSARSFWPTNPTDSRRHVSARPRRRPAR